MRPRLLEEPKIQIIVQCPDDTVVTINHRVTESKGTYRRFASTTKGDSTHFYRISARRSADKDEGDDIETFKKFEGDFYLSRNGGALSIFFDPSGKDKTLVWLDGRLVRPGEVRAPAPESKEGKKAASDKLDKGQVETAEVIPAFEQIPALEGEPAAEDKSKEELKAPAAPKS